MKFVAESLDTWVPGYIQFGNGVPGFSDLSPNDRTNLLKLASGDIWFLGAYRGFLKNHIFFAPDGDCRHRCEIDRLLGKEYTDCAFELASSLQKINLSQEEVVVLKAVCLTFSDRCDMESSAKVEEIQWKMLRCFLHLIHKNHQDQNLFYRVMNCVVSLRSLTEMSDKAFSSIHFVDTIRSNPLSGSRSCVDRFEDSNPILVQVRRS